MAGGLHWRNAVSRALRADMPALKPSPASHPRLFSSRTTSDCAAGPRKTFARSKLPQRLQSSPQSIAAQTIACNRRNFSSTAVSQHGHLGTPKPGEERRVTFITKEGESFTFEVADGDNLLDIAQEENLEMEGACGGSCACSTCHVIVQDPEMYDKMEEPDDDENDMLDLAFGLTETSRLGCQVKMSKELDGLVVKLPTMTRNLQASDFESK